MKPSKHRDEEGWKIQRDTENEVMKEVDDRRTILETINNTNMDHGCSYLEILRIINRTQRKRKIWLNGDDLTCLEVTAAFAKQLS